MSFFDAMEQFFSVSEVGAPSGEELGQTLTATENKIPELDPDDIRQQALRGELRPSLEKMSFGELRQVVEALASLTHDRTQDGRLIYNQTMRKNAQECLSEALTLVANKIENEKLSILLSAEHRELTPGVAKRMTLPKLEETLFVLTYARTSDEELAKKLDQAADDVRLVIEHRNRIATRRGNTSPSAEEIESDRLRPRFGEEFGHPPAPLPPRNGLS